MKTEKQAVRVSGNPYDFYRLIGGAVGFELPDVKSQDGAFSVTTHATSEEIATAGAIHNFTYDLADQYRQAENPEQTGFAIESDQAQAYFTTRVCTLIQGGEFAPFFNWFYKTGRRDPYFTSLANQMFAKWGERLVQDPAALIKKMGKTAHLIGGFSRDFGTRMDTMIRTIAPNQSPEERPQVIDLAAIQPYFRKSPIRRLAPDERDAYQFFAGHVRASEIVLPDEMNSVVHSGLVMPYRRLSVNS